MNLPHDAGLLEQLGTLDTPTVCNALELVCPERRGFGFTVEPLRCIRPELPPMVGYARTATIGAVQPANGDPAAQRSLRDAYYTHVADDPQPTIAVIQDLDGSDRGFGSFWGEVNSNIHRGLGCRGVITDGSVRDLPDIADGFQMLADRVGPSHAFVHLVDFNLNVSVAGMGVSPNDLIHADQHGAVVIPHAQAAEVMAAAELIVRREAPIIAAAKQPGFNLEKLREAWGEADEIH